MNKHLLETRLRSIKHYREEIQRLENAIKVNRETINEIEKSLVEFFPFKSGDIIYRQKSNRMLKVSSVKYAQVSGDSFSMVVSVHYQDSRYGFLNSTSTESYTIDIWNEFKKIGSDEEED